MADVLERQKRRPAAPPRDPRETLEPLLDELMRTLRFERAVVLLYDDERAALAGSFGTGVSDAIARELLIPLALADDPIVASLRGGVPQLIRDATLDERISAPVRETLSKAKLGPIVAAPLRSTTERPAGQDGKRGCEVLRAAGAEVLAQDQASSVVWGMPGAVVGAGLADTVLPLTEIGGYLTTRLATRTVAQPKVVLS